MHTDLSTESQVDQREALLPKAATDVDFRYAEQRWLVENEAKLPGEWLAIQGSVLVRRLKKICEVEVAVGRVAVQHPLMVFVDPDE